MEEKYFLLLDSDNKTFTEKVDFKLMDSTDIGTVLKAEKWTVFGAFLGLKKNDN